MAFFELDIKKMEYNVHTFNDRVLELKEQLGITYDRLINIDSCWNGVTCSKFIDVVRSDGYKIDEYLDNLSAQYNEIDIFINGIKSVCKKYGYKNVNSIKFDDSRISDCIGHLNFIIEVLNKCILKLGNSNEKVDRILDVIKMVNDYKENLMTFRKNINNYLEESRNRNAKKEINKLNVSLIKYNNN